MCTELERALGREMITLGVYRPINIIKDIITLLDLIKVRGYIYNLVALI